MKRLFLFCLMLGLFSPAIPVQVLASRPVVYFLTGCVLDGMLFSVQEGAIRPGSGTQWKAYYIKVEPPTVNLSRYEGRKIQVRGVLLPGDVFHPDLHSLKIIGVCDEETRLAVRQELSNAYRAKAEEKAEQGDWKSAGDNLDKAIRLAPADCSLFLTRAKFYQKQGKIKEATRDAQKAVQLGCGRYPDLTFLAELLEKSGQKAAALRAYEQALAACHFQPDKERLGRIINRLKNSTLPGPPKQEGAAHGEKKSSTTIDPGGLPPPPPLPD